MKRGNTMDIYVPSLEVIIETELQRQESEQEDALRSFSDTELVTGE